LQNPKEDMGIPNFFSKKGIGTLGIPNIYKTFFFLFFLFLFLQKRHHMCGAS